MSANDEIKAAQNGIALVGEIIKVAGNNPDVKEAGENLGKTALTITKAINNVLLPIAAINFGFDKARKYFGEKFLDDMAKKVAVIPQEQIIEPKASIAGPALQGLAFSHDEDNLREMYLSLLATAMDGRVASGTHPAFVEIIRQLSKDEAVILQQLASSKNYPTILRANQRYTTNAAEEVPIVPFESLRNGFLKLCRTYALSNNAMAAAYLDNLLRLQVLELHFEESHCFRDNAFNRLRESYSAVHEQIEMEYEREESLRFSKFGEQFVSVCVRH